MSFQGQPGAEGSLSESVHFPPTSSYLEYQGGYHVDGRMAMAPPLSSASRAPVRPPVFHDDGRGGGPPHYGVYDRPEYEYALRRHSCGDHIGLHSGNLIEHLLLQENQKALRMASIVQSQASGCLSGCLSCGGRSRFRDSEERILDEQRCFPRNVVGEGPSRSANPEANAAEFPDGWIRQANTRQTTGERSQGRISFSEDEHGRSLCQGRRISYPACHPTVSHSQASHHVQDHHLLSVGAAESSVPVLGFGDADGRDRQRWPLQRQSHSDIGTEEDGWQRPSRSKGAPARAREQDRLSLPGIVTGSLPRTVVGSPHRPAGDSVLPPQSTRTSSQSLLAIPDNSTEPSYQDNALEQTSIQRLVTQGPISLTNWYIMKVQVGEVGRVLEMKVAVGGWLSQNREHVRTSPIVNRLDIHKVVSEDGVEVFLVGAMDQEASTANGFSPGIVQCLSAGFPYMWKQLLRVRPAGESSSLAVSESLGGLHPNASKCLSEDESQGVNDPKISKSLPEDFPCSLRDCEGTSPTTAVNEDCLAIQTAVNVASDVVETVSTATAGAEKSHVEAPDAGTARVETSHVETQETCLARAETLDVVEAEAAVPTRSGTSDVVLAEAEAPAEAEASEIVVKDAAVPARTDTSGIVETEATIFVGAQSSGAIDECRPQHELLQQSSDFNPTSLDPAPTTEAPLENVTDDFLAKEAESALVTDANFVTIRRSRKSKKEILQPVRSSKRLQKRQSRLSDFAPKLVDSQRPQIELVTCGMDFARITSAVEEHAEFVPDVEQATAGREELTTTTSIIEEVLLDLQQADAEAVDQDPVKTATDPQRMEVEEFGQPENRCEYLTKDSDGAEIHKSNEQEESAEAVLAGVESDAPVPPVASTDLETEMEETTPVAPPNVDTEQTVPAAPLELEREESAPTTPPELPQRKVPPRVNSLSNPSSRPERVFPETNARVTRSLKRRLNLTPTNEADALPVPGSRKRLRRLSDPASNPVSNPVFNLDMCRQEEGAHVEPVSNPDTALQQEVDAFHVRVRDLNSAKAVNCSNCKQPCSPQDLLKYSRNVASSGETPEVVPKEEGVEYAPLPPIEPTVEPQGHRTGTCSMSRRLGRFKKMKPATRFANIGTSRRRIVGESGSEPAEGNESSGGNERVSKAKVSWKGKGSRKGKGFKRGEGSSKTFRKVKGSRQREGSSKGKGSSEGEVSGEVKRSREMKRPREVKRTSEVEGCNEGFGPELSQGKNRRKSMLPPPLPPPRVQDKSKVSEAFGLKTSRSGRLLVPPLAFWRSQSIEYDKDGGIIAIFDGFQANPADTGCFNFTPPQEKHAKRIQEKLCKAAAAVTKRK